MSPTASCARPLGPSRLRSRLLLGVSRTDRCRRLLVLVVEERQKIAPCRGCEAHQYDPTVSRNAGCNFSVSARIARTCRQGKACAAANAGRGGLLPDTSSERPRYRVADERLAAPRRQPLLGRYRLLERLGAGGFGTVWRAHDELLDRTVALKRIPLPSEEDRERATREAHATARLSHPAIVSLYEASADEDAFYLISELVEGDTLAQLIADD